MCVSHERSKRSKMSRPLPEVLAERNAFMNKPTQGWLHSNRLIMKRGVAYAVRYIGCLEVKTSMKSLDFTTRSQVAKECINKVCEVAGLKTVDKKRKVDKGVLRCIGEKPIMEHAGANVNLTVSSTALILTSHDSGKVIAEHEMPRISFASGGDTDTLDFVGYVAKDIDDWRACYVLECGGGLAQDVIATIAQAFELRLRQFLSPAELENELATNPRDQEYYNDLPGKIPPDVGPPPVPPLPAPHHHTVINVPPPPEPTCGSFELNSASYEPPRDVGANLIDLHSEPVPKPAELEYVNVVPVSSQNTQAPLIAAPTTMHTTAAAAATTSTTITTTTSSSSSTTATNDVFDLKHLGMKLGKKQSPIAQRNQLENEVWFHGFVNRQDAEAMLTKDGEFLVRESQGSPGQYVLTGMQGGVKKHLLLIDPEGVVRTKDKMFESVNHLINYHVENQLPIISAESALILRHPVHRKAR